MDVWDLAAKIGFHPTQADKRNMNDHKHEAFFYIDCAAFATQKTLSRFGSSGRRDNNEANAFKHTLWNALMVYSFTRHMYRQTSFDFGTSDSNKWSKSVTTGVQKAEFWASGHEDYTDYSDADASRKMDYLNNQRGREIARLRLIKTGSGALNFPITFIDQLTDDVLATLRRGELVVISKEGKSGYY
jgi:hypothetical protein